MREFYRTTRTLCAVWWWFYMCWDVGSSVGLSWQADDKYITPVLLATAADTAAAETSTTSATATFNSFHNEITNKIYYELILRFTKIREVILTCNVYNTCWKVKHLEWIKFISFCLQIKYEYRKIRLCETDYIYKLNKSVQRHKCYHNQQQFIRRIRQSNNRNQKQHHRRQQQYQLQIYKGASVWYFYTLDIVAKSP